LDVKLFRVTVLPRRDSAESRGHVFTAGKGWRWVAAADFSDEVLEKLEPFDQEFFSYPHNLTELLFAYVSQHPQEFGELPRPDDA
jgi:hypothetical protein